MGFLRCIKGGENDKGKKSKGRNIALAAFEWLQYRIILLLIKEG